MAKVKSKQEIEQSRKIAIGRAISEKIIKKGREINASKSGSKTTMKPKRYA